MLDDSRTDLDAAMKELAVAIGEVERFVAETRDKTAEQVQRLANTTQVLADHHMDVENILHIAPTAFANSYNILNPNLPGAVGTFVLNNNTAAGSITNAITLGDANTGANNIELQFGSGVNYTDLTVGNGVTVRRFAPITVTSNG